MDPGVLIFAKRVDGGGGGGGQRTTLAPDFDPWPIGPVVYHEPMHDAIPLFFEKNYVT